MDFSIAIEDIFDQFITMETDVEEVESNASVEQDSIEQDGDADNAVEETIVQKPRVTLTDLPENVKIKILEYVGLLRPCLINIVYEKSQNKQEGAACGMGNAFRMSPFAGAWVDSYFGQCHHSPLPLQLFLTSRAFHRDLASIFWSRNMFSIYLFSKSEFKIFRDATNWGLVHLKHLYIDLGPRERRYLKLSGGLHRTIMNMWASFCENATERMPSLKFFNMKCRVKDLEVAMKLMCAMDPFPTLTHCAFHLSLVQDDDIRPVIKRAAWRLTNNLDSRGPFPFLSLPKEIQLMVLEFVLVGRTDPLLSTTERSPGIVSFQKCKRQELSSDPLHCCGTCSTLRAICFCYGYQTAFSTSCSCFSSPVPYFLVSRGFYEDCRRVFFSKNLFAFVDEEPDTIMRFMHSIPTASFMQIRHLSFKFPLSYRVFPRPGRSEEAALLSWSVVRRFIREHFDLSRLSLTIVDCGTKNNIAHRVRYMRKVLKGFSDLQGLRDFGVYLADDRLFEEVVECAVLGPASSGRRRLREMPFLMNGEYESDSI